MDLSDYTALFLGEAREQITTMNRLLLALEKDPTDRGMVDELFRAVHTLKGSSGAMGYTGVAGIAHALEHTLESVRAGRARMDPEVVDTMLAATDSLDRELEQQATGAATPPPAGGAGGSRHLVRAYVTIAPDAPFPAVRALLVLRAARAIGEVSEVTPPESAIAAGECEHELAFLLDTSSGDAEVVAKLSIVGEVDRVEVATPTSSLPSLQAEGAGPTVRVAQARLDRLVDYVGEMVFSRDRLRRVAAPAPGSELDRSLDEMAALIGRVRDEVMRLSRVPAAEALDRLPRAVRDTARALGKEIDFELIGREAQLDRAVLREAVDLLIHLLRNAVDHGIESPEERVAAGKSRRGRVTLSAEIDRATAVLRVDDDGRGLQRATIVALARERGLLAESAAELTDNELLELVTRPGFSTSGEVTAVSGRGVGLDAVRSRVEQLGGAVELSSRPGEGTTFTLRLPLTLSIVRVLHLVVGEEVYALPISAVEEVGEVEPANIALADGRESTEFREERLPLLRLPSLLLSGALVRAPEAAPLVVIAASGRRFGLLVDSVRGQGEAVVKRFAVPIGSTPIFGGAMLLDDGTPALILDPDRLGGFAERSRPLRSAGS